MLFGKYMWQVPPVQVCKDTGNTPGVPTPQKYMSKLEIINAVMHNSPQNKKP